MLLQSTRHDGQNEFWFNSAAALGQVHQGGAYRFPLAVEPQMIHTPPEYDAGYAAAVREQPLPFQLDESAAFRQMLAGTAPTLSGQVPIQGQFHAPGSVPTGLVPGPHPLGFQAMQRPKRSM